MTSFFADKTILALCALLRIVSKQSTNEARLLPLFHWAVYSYMTFLTTVKASLQYSFPRIKVSWYTKKLPQNFGYRDINAIFSEHRFCCPHFSLLGACNLLLGFGYSLPVLLPMFFPPLLAPLLLLLLLPPGIRLAELHHRVLVDLLVRGQRKEVCETGLASRRLAAPPRPLDDLEAEVLVACLVLVVAKGGAPPWRRAVVIQVRVAPPPGAPTLTHLRWR